VNIDEMEREIVRLRKLAMDFQSLSASYKYKYFETLRLLQQTRIALAGYIAENKLLRREIEDLKKQLKMYKERYGDIISDERG